MHVGSVSRIDPDRRASLAKMFLRFLPEEDRSRHPTYWALCRGIAEDPELLAIADLVPPPQFPVNVFLAAVHHLLLQGADHDLATHYRSVCERRHLEFGPVADEALVASFRSFCTSFEPDIAERCTTRATQTNEVGRCGALRAALCSLGVDGGPIALVDLGCSAGLNLFVDAYRYDYGDGVVLGSGDGPLLTCAARGAVPRGELPRIASRVGLDLSPVEVRDADEVLWLLACLWPDDLARFDRLERAAAVVAARRDELVLLQGDMVDAVGTAVAASDPDARLVLLDSWSIAYLPTDRRRALRDEVDAIAAHRPLTWVSMESPRAIRELGLLDGELVLHNREASVVCVSRLAASASSVIAAEVHAHGLWLEWLDGVASPSS